LQWSCWSNGKVGRLEPYEKERATNNGKLEEKKMGHQSNALRCMSYKNSDASLLGMRATDKFVLREIYANTL
jgi:hypothetical protein